MRKSVIVLCAVFLISGCATMTYSNRYDPGENFAQLRTYETMPLPEKKKEDTLLLLKNLRFAVNNTLQAKGYTEVESNPDFLVAVHAVTRRAVDVEQYGYAYSTGFFDHPAFLDHRHRHDREFLGPDFYEYRSGVDYYEYRVATLVVDIVRADRKELVWRGTAEGVLEDNVTPEYVQKIVTNIMKGFPPPAGK